MAIELLRILIVSNILGYVLVNGRPNGAPPEACATIIPGHVPNSPSTDPFPYSVDISSLDNGYDPGENYNITLRGSRTDRNFRGFMIQGRVRADDSPAGTFGSGTNYQPQCSGNTAATHTGRNQKRMVNLVWTAPPADTGFVCFRYAFVDAYATFWANLTTQCVSQTFILTASGAILGNNITVFYNVSQSSMCTCQLESDSPVPCDSGHMFTNLTVGEHNVSITCTSQSTGLTVSRTLNFRVEVVTSGSAGIVGDTVILTLDANANGTYQCSLDGGEFQPCFPGSIFARLSVGQHTIDVRFTPTGSTQVTAFQLQFNIAGDVGDEFSVTASAIYSGDKITVTYDASAGAMCTCQLDSGASVPCDSGHMFNNVPDGEHTVIVRCTSADGLMTVSSTVSGLQFLSVQLSLESSGTSITVIPETNIEATHRCRLDDGPFVDCFAGFQFQGVSEGMHTVTVESTSLNRLTSLNTTGTTTVRGSDAILITDIIPDINIADQIYNFTFMINEKLDDLNITLLIDDLPITVPFDCVRISDEMCYCTFRIANMEYTIGTHTLTFQSVLNGEVRGSTRTMFIVTDTALAKFRDIEYSVVEGDGMFRVEIEKTGTTAQTVTLSIQFIGGTAMSRSDYPVFQAAQAVVIPPGPSIDIPVDLSINNDEIVECNETFTLRLVSLDTVRLQIDPARAQATVTIIDDDATTVAFPGSPAITEGVAGPVEISYLGTIAQNFTVTVESYRCTGSAAATPGVDYVPVNVRLTFTPTSRSQIITVMTIDDNVFEDDERICLRLTNLTEPCPGSVILGNDTEVVIAEDEIPVFTLLCYTNTTGNSIVGRNISLFYSSPASGVFVPEFRCALDGGALELCASDPPTVYGPLSYGNHTVTVRAQSGVTLEEIIITHQVLMVQARLGVVNSSAIQISIQSTKDATYRCRLNDGPYFTCNDGDVVGNLPPMMYTLMVEATSDDDPAQHASDVVGPITLTGGSSGSTCAGSMNLTTPNNLSSYQAEWRSRGDRVVFSLRAEGQGWVGIGFSHNRMMAISDIILGAADASNSFVDDRFAFTRDITVQPPRDPIQNVDNTFASFVDGFTTVRFSRQKETGDVNDFSLNYCIFFLFAWGGAVTDFSTGQIEYHGFNRRFISDSLICLPFSPFCPERVDCGQPGTPINGAVMLFNDTMEDSVAVYSCNFGFRLVGDRERTCRFSRFVDQMWTGDVPICMRITCGDPGVPMNGSVTSNGTFVTSIAEFTCDFGFDLIGDTQRVCQPNGNWSNMVPECRRITCGDPGMPMNGSVTSNGTYVTSVAEFTCDFGFELINDTQRVCQPNGMWSNMVPECRRINCGDPGVPMNGVVSTNGTYVTSVAEFTCDDGYMRVGDAQRVCQPDGTWSNMVPDCLPVDCGSPGTPTNGNAIIISTTFGTTIMYSCNQRYVLCGSDSRTCQANATWSGEVPDCIRSVATVESTSYTVIENAGSVGIGVELDRPNCQPVNFLLTPQVQSPVDASTSDFDNTPINVTIPAGETRTTVLIPITNDMIVEGPERFDAVLSDNNNIGVIIGDPGQAEVTIVDDGDTMTVMFEMSMYNLTEVEGQVEVCLLSDRDNEIPVSVTVQPEESGSAEEPDDFMLATSTVTFAPGQLRACYNQSIIDDDVPEMTESFTVRIVDNPNITPGDPQVTQINIIDDDGSMIMRNDTVIGDPLYTVPLQISEEMIEANPNVTNTSLCYEIHGRSGNTYNLVSDTCVSVSADYVQGNTSDINVIGRVGVLAVDNDGNCQRITINVTECTGTVGSTEVTQGSPYDNAGIRVRKGSRHFRIAVPNCERQDLVSWVICEEGDMLKFVITRGFNLQPTSHGLVGQFWNIPVELEEYTGPVPPNDTLSYYTVSVTPPDGDVRSFVGHLYDVTWDFTPVPCVYAGNRNGGPVFEFNNPNDPVIEGNYTQYQVSDIFSTQFTYEQFDESRCN